MPRKPGTRPAGSRAKWGAVALLALVFVYVMSRPGSKEQPAPVPSNPPVPSGPRLPGSVAQAPSRATRPLKPAALETVLGFNPFEFHGRSLIPGASNPEPSATSVQRPAVAARKPPKPPDATKQLRTSVSGEVADIIFESPRGRSARVGKRIIREGQPFGRGGVVRRIQPDNVILQARPGHNQ